MFRLAIPAICPRCQQNVPRAAARRCPFCHLAFPPPPSIRAVPARPERPGSNLGNEVADG